MGTPPGMKTVARFATSRIELAIRFTEEGKDHDMEDYYTKHLIHRYSLVHRVVNQHGGA
ncbi:MAG: hypothetical protein BroJett015_41690 [Chloroflexota bacterium]|nr:MAG: hypothetical protein BroJett015_41690 [Chloroflexota bacterium]